MEWGGGLIESHEAVLASRLKLVFKVLTEKNEFDLFGAFHAENKCIKIHIAFH